MQSDVDQKEDSARAVPIAIRVLIVVGFLYLFLVGIGLLETGIAGLGQGFQTGLLQSVSNPISGVCAGLLVTVLVQSSSVTTSAIVGMVGAGTLPVVAAVPMVMGANIGTTVTATLASLGTIRRSGEFRRAFAAATMHDFFNLLGVVILLPIEVATGVLSKAAAALTDVLRGTDFNPAQPSASPIRTAVHYPVDWIAGLFPAGAGAAILLLIVGLILIFVALTMITRNMRQLVAGGVERLVNQIIGRGGGAIGILVGIAVTVSVQSSSITTSILVPLVASGVLAIRSAYPITLGANIGTTITALLASLAVARPEGLTIALVHTLFNLTAMLIIYPLPRTRYIPVQMAEALAEAATRRHSIIFAFGVGVFIVLPLLGLFLLQ